MKKVTIGALGVLTVQLLSAATVDLGNLTINGDYRFSVDSLNYEMANGQTIKNESMLTNRLWLETGYKKDKVTFRSRIGFNKAFGQVMTQPGNMDSFDWLGSTSNTDNQLRVIEAYIDYADNNFLGLNIPYVVGVGRRPAIYNKLNALRDGEKENSPLGHIVSAEFDGGSLKLDLSEVTNIKGSSIKLAIGRGSTNVSPFISPTPVANSGEDINMAGLNIIAFSDEKLHAEMQLMMAENLVDITNGGFDMMGSFNPNSYNPTLENVGDLYLGSAMLKYRLESLNDTILFASYAFSKTDPNKGKTMLGSPDSEVGHSFWVGVQTQSLLSKNGRWGVEYNQGSQYFRSFTYAEDTLIGSKLATRGSAYEVYFTEEIVENLSVQARFTMIDYKYTGSNGFFGSQTGAAMKISDIPTNTDIAGSVVDKATDIRLYARYRF